jgi:hypothetical protein
MFFGVTDKTESFQIGDVIIGLVSVYVMRMQKSLVRFQGKAHFARFTPVPCCSSDHFTDALKIRTVDIQWSVIGVVLWCLGVKRSRILLKKFVKAE